jgi:hypothetical protein
MKKSILIIFCLTLELVVTAQTWKTDIQRTTGKPVTRTLKLKPKTELRVGTLLNDADSIKESKFYYGKFLSGNKDSLKLKVISIENLHTESAGLKQSEVTQAKYFTRYKADSVYNASVAITDVHFIKYQQDYQKFFGGGEDFLLLGSLAVLVVSPFICYNYKEGAFNAESYKYWALSCTAGIVVGFSFQILGGERKLQFKPNWPDKDARVWSFKN